MMTVFFVWICFLLQSTLFQAIAFNDIVPDLLIIVTASYGFMEGDRKGLLVGFFCGFLCDIFFGDVIGFHALLMMLIGFLNGKFSGGFYPDDIKLPLGLIVMSDLTYCLACYVFQFLLRGRLNFPHYFTSIILPEVVYTTLVTVVLYPLLLIVNMWRIKKEKRGARKFV